MSTTNKHITLIAVSALVFANIVFGADSQEPNFTDFYRVLETGTDEQAAQTAQKIFERIERKYRADAGFGALKSKMMAADFLANQMVTQLKKATGRQMFAVAGELFEDKTKGKNRDSLSVAPAKSFYETSQQIFSKPVSISELEDEEKQFLAGFYDLKLRILTSAIAKAGQALAIAEPSFKGTYDYVLVLPLLHASETKPVNIDVLPKWMRQSSQLNVFSDSCLLHYGFAYHAQAFARAAAEPDKKDFSQENFYRAASKKCAKQLPRVAVDSLKRAIDSIDEEKTDERIALQFDIVQVWLDSDNFTLAAGEAKSIADNFPGHKRSGNAIWLHFYALSRTNNVKTILTNIDTVIADPRCTDYRAKLMYMKWWALRRQKDQAAQIAALEHQLITDYGDDVMVAPIILSRATDLLGGQDYTGAFALLDQVQEKFPSTKAAGQAKKMIEKLKNMQGSK
ncbi:MAG: tetratricopeptide repeat protein [Planctomycetota bacterium]|jgi:hypothetical protein